MAVPIIASSTSATNGGTTNSTIVLTEPSGLSVDDLIILVFGDEAGNVNGCPDLSAQGFTRITHPNNSGDVQMALYWKIATGSESWPITITGADGGTEAVGWALRITGIDTTTPIHKTGAWYGEDSTGSTAVPAEVTTTVADCLGLAVAYYDGADVCPAAVTGTGWSLIASLENPSNSSQGVGADYATKSIAAAGGSDACTFTMSAADGRMAIQIAIAPGGGSAALTGTAVAGGVLESEIVTGGETIIITLTDDTWIAAGTGPIGTDANTQALIDGIDGDVAGGTGWDAQVKATLVPDDDVVRTSDTVCTVTLNAAAAYAISSNETITVTIPAEVLTGGVEITADATFAVTNEAGGLSIPIARRRGR